MAMAAANAVLDVILEDGFLDHVQEMSFVLQKSLADVAIAHPEALGKVRGRGLLIGVECKGTNTDMVKKLEGKGLLTVAAGNNVVRFIPPLIVEKSHLDEAITLLYEACEEMEKQGTK